MSSDRKIAFLCTYMLLSDQGMPKKIYDTDVLLFDWSGTISDDRQLVYETNQRLLEAYGQPRLSLNEWRNGREGWNAGNYLARELNLPIVGLYEQFAELLAKTKAELGEPKPYAGAIEAFRGRPPYHD